MKPTTILLSLLALATPQLALAQSPAKIKSQLQQMEKDAKKDPEALFAAAQFAAQKGLANDAKRLYAAILKIAPDHEGANAGLGNEQVDGKWLPAKEAAAARKKAMAAEYSAKGFVEVDGVWVDKAEVDDAKRGIFRHDGELVTKEEKLALMAGKVRHPETGELIDARNLEKAQNRYFPIGNDGRWVDENEANKFHADLAKPWVVRSSFCTLLTTLEIGKVEAVKREADRGYEAILEVFGGVHPKPTHRPVVILALTDDEFRQLGQAFSDGTDASGAFLMGEEGRIRVPGLGEVRGGITHYPKDLGPYYLRHAVALAFTHGVASEHGVELPSWFQQGLGSLARYFMNESDAGWFAKPLAQKGGARNLKGFFAGFAISGDMESTDISATLYQAGLMIAYARRSGDEQAKALLQDVVDVATGKKKGGIEKPIKALEAHLIASEAAIGTYLNQLLAKAPK